MQSEIEDEYEPETAPTTEQYIFLSGDQEIFREALLHCSISNP